MNECLTTKVSRNTNLLSQLFIEYIKTYIGAIPTLKVVQLGNYILVNTLWIRYLCLFALMVLSVPTLSPCL